jgi:ferredoxin
MYRFLKKFRVVISSVIFLLLLICFIDSYQLINQWSSGLLKWQFVPALLGFATGSAIILIVLLLLTLVFGRVYCSTLCPLGTYQDSVRRISNMFRSKRKRRLSYSKPYNILRYVILGLTVILFILGNATLLLWLDPYSNFGRMATNLLGPVIIAGGNLLSDSFPSIPLQDYGIFTQSTCIAAAVLFIVVTGISIFRGRLYCNSICPVGSLLGVIANYSLFRLSFDTEACTRCHACSRHCKAQCIDVKAQSVDHSRCVQCLNCTVSCNVNAIRYHFAYNKKHKREITKIDPLRRRIFLGALGGVAAAGVARAFTPAFRRSTDNIKAITPPGSISLDNLKYHCTACHACVANCPSEVLRPAIGEYGLDGFMLPVLDYNKSFCNYECIICSTVCPNGAIQLLTKEEKVVTQIGKATFKHERCIVVTDETDCGACDEHCPVKAIRMVPFHDSLLVPELDTTLCIGCGGCEYICPARPHKAIYVVANTVHEKARPVVEEKQNEIDVDGFGF